MCPGPNSCAECIHYEVGSAPSIANMTIISADLLRFPSTNSFLFASFVLLVSCRATHTILYLPVLSIPLVVLYSTALFHSFYGILQLSIKCKFQSVGTRKSCQRLLDGVRIPCRIVHNTLIVTVSTTESNYHQFTDYVCSSLS